MNRLSLQRLSWAVLAIGFLLPAQVRAQGSLPPAHTYHVDRYGRETRVVKERWSENSRGEKQGMYLRYDANGAPEASVLYVNGVKSGPSSEVVTDGWTVKRKFVGAYVNGNKDGWWNTYWVRADGRQELEKREKYAQGAVAYQFTFKDGKSAGAYAYANNEKNGPARVYGATDAEQATGLFANGEPSGTWLNAAYEKSGIVNEIVYQKGAKLVFEHGALTTIVDPSGSVRSLTAERAQAAAESAKRAAATEARNEDARLSYIALPSQITFYSDSYVMTKAATQELDALAKEINLRRQSPKYQVKQLYISAHTDTPKGEITEDSEKQMYVLTLNRTSALSEYLLSQLTDRSITITTYPCGLSLPTSEDGRYGKRIQFSIKQDMPWEHAAYDKLAGKYNLKSGAGLVPSTVLQENILNTLRAFFNDEGIRSTIGGALADERDPPVYAEKIPSELWLSDLETRVPKNYAQVENIEQFRRRVESLVTEMNQKYGSKLPVSTFFNEDLRRRTKQL